MTSLQHGEGPRFESEWLYFLCLAAVSLASYGEVAERSKALRQGRNLFGGVGSNPTLVTLLEAMLPWGNKLQGSIAFKIFRHRELNPGLLGESQVF